ncbi:MAG: hypothetical protein KDA96_16375 [Planctomycetaceae bacterium]|nr:hypothetical protein [Planctomycetaceae bacterium]
MPAKNASIGTQALSDAASDNSSERVIVHAAYPIWRKHTLIAMARARQLQDAGHSVTLSYCDASAGTCAVNFAGSPVVCSICQSRTRQTAESLGLTTVPLGIPQIATAVAVKEAPLADRVHIAEGVRSALVSTFRMMPTDLCQSVTLQLIKRRYYATAMRMLAAMNRLVRKIGANRIEVFNGRQACSRFCITSAHRSQIAFSTLEVCTKQHPIVFHGHTAHDRHFIQQRIMSHPADMEIAEQYYARRRQPRTNKFAKKHSSAFQPPAKEGFRRCVSVFLSSQDEFESLGKEWRSPFPPYAEVIEDLCQRHPETLFAIRFHPNQADISSDIRTPFHEIESLPNCVIYYPETTANTYRLIEWADVVLTFGSTVTVEACWVGKPVVMLGPSFFDELNVSYNPSTLEELHVLMQSDLKPKDRTNCARWAVFEETDWDDLPMLSHNGRTFVPQGFDVSKSGLARIARTCDDAFCNLVKLASGQAAMLRRLFRRRSRSAQSADNRDSTSDQNSDTRGKSRHGSGTTHSPSAATDRRVA